MEEEVNQRVVSVAVLVISSGTVSWYDGIWQIGMLLPIILIYFYNGESGKKNIVNKWSFYLFYPIHFLVFWLILKFKKFDGRVYIWYTLKQIGICGRTILL